MSQIFFSIVATHILWLHYLCQDDPSYKINMSVAVSQIIWLTVTYNIMWFRVFSARFSDFWYSAQHIYPNCSDWAYAAENSQPTITTHKPRCHCYNMYQYTDSMGFTQRAWCRYHRWASNRKTEIWISTLSLYISHL